MKVQKSFFLMNNCTKMTGADTQSSISLGLGQGFRKSFVKAIARAFFMLFRLKTFH